MELIRGYPSLKYVKFLQKSLLLAFKLLVADNFNYELSKLHHD